MLFRSNPHAHLKQPDITVDKVLAVERRIGLEFLSDKVAKWWLPDRVVFIEEIPKTGTGKFDKKVVREEYADLLL